MTYEELKIQLDLCNPEDIFPFVGIKWNDCRFVVCDDGDCHIFQSDGTEDDIRKVDRIVSYMIRTDIKKIVIPDSVMSIGSWAFSGCRGLTCVTIGNSVTSIGKQVFSSCSGLTNIMIPDSVKSIETFAFDACYNLKSLVFKGKTMDEVKAMDNYPWGIDDKSIIKCI